MQSNSQPGGPGSAEFRLMTTTLEKALSAVRDKKQSRKLGRYEMDTVHRIQVRITLFLIVGEEEVMTTSTFTSGRTAIVQAVRERGESDQTAAQR
jgi:hypothetical protein